MTKKANPKTKARLSILGEMLAFPTISQKDWTSGGAIVGDLVSLQSAPPSKWYVSWLIETRCVHDREYLLESIDDGSLCWWSNVSLNHYNRERVGNNPTWRWEDRQFDFWKRWRKAASTDSWLLRPSLPEFSGFKVTLSVRKTFESGVLFGKEFLDWRKLKISDMIDYYNGCLKNELMKKGL